MNRLSKAFFALTILACAVPVSAAGRSEDRGAGFQLPPSVQASASEEWIAAFEAVLEGNDAEGVPRSILAQAISGLPANAAELSPSELAAIVRREAVMLDRSIRAGVPGNRASLASAQRIRSTVAEAIRIRTETRAENRANRGPGGADMVSAPNGFPGSGAENRAEASLRERTSPVDSPGGPPGDAGKRPPSDHQPEGQGNQDADSPGSNDTDHPGAVGSSMHGDNTARE